MEHVAERVTRVQLRTLCAGAKTFPAVVVHVADLRLSADLVNDRQIRLAHRLAESHGIEVDVAPDLQARVAAAMRNDAPDGSDAVIADVPVGVVRSEGAFEKAWAEHPLAQRANPDGSLPLLVQSYKDVARQVWERGLSLLDDKEGSEHG